MIKKIIVALDPDSDTKAATRYAIDVAKRHDARITGLAVVDTQSIDSSARGGGIGSFYFAEKLKTKLTEESRSIAQNLLREFHDVMEGSNVPYDETVEEGVPFERIVEDLKYHDMLVIGNDPHFFYAHPKKETHTLARVVKNTICPTLVVGKKYNAVKDVLIAYDGSSAAARAVQRLAQLKLFGDDLNIVAINVFHGDASESELLLQLLDGYLKSHGLNARTQSLDGRHPGKEIIGMAKEVGADVIVAGAHAVSAIKKLAFGSTTAALLDNDEIPLLVDS